MMSRSITNVVAMNAAEVVELLEALDEAGIGYWVAGGWGIDSLLQQQTRPHKDIDLLVQSTRLAAVERLLSARGFRRADESEWPAFLVLRDDAGRQVDLYLIEFDEHGECWQQFSDRRWDHFSTEELSGSGRISDHNVRCLSAEGQFRQFLGYEWGDTALHDLTRLRDTFGIALPPGLRP
jgi:lincosamide nucleotidyltransferase A/C/D/E